MKCDDDVSMDGCMADHMVELCRRCGCGVLHGDWRCVYDLFLIELDPPPGCVT